MQNVAIAGVAPPAGLGDALQHYVLAKLLNNLLPEADAMFLCPHLREEISVFQNLKLNARLVSVSLTGAGLLRYLLRSCATGQPTDQKNMSARDRNASAKANMINKLTLRAIRIISKHETSVYKPGRKCWAPYIFGKYVGSAISRALFSFSAGIFAGHTICINPYYFVVQYENLHSAVKGTMITSPISISKLAFGNCRDNTLLKSMKQSLCKFDFIYVRGPYSLEFLRDQLKIDYDKVAMALDSGFGLRLIHPCTRKVSKNRALKVVIIPRTDYFRIYNQRNLIEPYLNALIGLVQWLFKSFDAEVYFASQIVNHMSKSSDMDRIVMHLKKRAYMNNNSPKLKIIKPNNIIEAYELYSSADFVVSSYMHGGIMALNAGVPTVFISPIEDTKVLDVLSFLHLEWNRFLIDMLDPHALRAENFINVARGVIDNLECDSKTIELAVKKALPTVELPIKRLAKSLH